MSQEPKKNFAVCLKTYGNDLSKRWRVEYCEQSHNGQHSKRKVIYGNINKGKTIDERLQLAQDVINRVQAGEPTHQNILRQIIDERAPGWRSKTLSAYNTLEKKFAAFLGKTKPENVTTQTVTDFFVYCQKNGSSVGTLYGYRMRLYNLYERCVARGFVLVNPVKKTDIFKKSPSSLHYFSDKQIAEIKAACLGTQLWLAIRLLFYCFVRPGEQRFLKIENLNFEMGFIEIPASISKNKKTQKVVIPESFLTELEFLKNYPNNYYLLSRTGSPGPLPIGANHLNNEHKKVLDALKIRGRYAFYSWKHTGVVKCVQAKLNIRDIQNQLRHHSLDMVQEYLKSLGVLQSVDLKNRFPVL